MIIFVCGLIGAGKTTFAKNQEGIVSDFDDFGSKEKQMEYTINHHLLGKKVYHITCYPDSDELELINRLHCRCLWINTEICQAMKNILSRNRDRDIDDLKNTKQENLKVQNKYIDSKLKFEIVNVFETDERW